MLMRRFVMIPALLFTVCCISACTMMPRGDCETCDDACPGAAMRVCTDPTMMALAADLDSLQRHIDEHGSVVSKQADVWGQARMTRHREQFEAQMASELGNFRFSMQGALTRSDQAYFANALALSAAASGASTTSETNLVDTSTLINSPVDTGFITRNNARTTTSTVPTLATAQGLSLEPTVLLDQQKRYLDHLNEIRRINEGDDRADSPGYALHLVRLPVSVLPGRKTEQGYGAEITFSVKPYLTAELLPTTFRNLVVNDVIDQLAFPITKLINDKDSREALDKLDPLAKAKIELLEKLVCEASVKKPVNEADWKKLEAYKEIEEFEKKTPEAKGFVMDIDKILNEGQKNAAGLYVAQQIDLLKSQVNATTDAASKDDFQKASNVLSNLSTHMRNETWSANSSADVMSAFRLNKSEDIKKLPKGAIDIVNNTLKQAQSANSFNATKAPIDEKILALKKKIGQLSDTIKSVSLSPSRQRIARFALPPSQIQCVLGDEYLRIIARSIHAKMKKELDVHTVVHLSDIQGLLQEEVVAAHTFLSAHEKLWHTFCTETLAKLIRKNDCCTIDEWRKAYHCQVQCFLPNVCKSKETADFMEALGWCVIVESTLLNQQLVQDIQETAVTKGCAELKQYAGVWQPYFLPKVTGVPNEAFQAYVKCRWPIQVFALDPVTQDQNISDRYSARREMQLALSLAFVSGHMSASNLTRYARRIEVDMDTIDLNRTAVGFSHGESTFGWRFYPRFQSPDIESNLKVLTRDLWMGGPSREALLRQRRMEPGPRECMALVIMPSFVPYVTIDSTSNWFQLTNARHKVMDHKDAMQLSRAVRKIQSCSGNVNDMQCYREGEWERLVERAKELETRLPTQTMMSQVPYENTLGGFEMFNNGITDLAPELYGYYGEPGIKPTGKTTLFLVGNHFSVLNTKTIVGGLAMVGSAGVAMAPKDAAATPAAAPAAAPVITQTLLSRQVMMITVDVPAADPLTMLKNKHVDVHVATPYGVSRHLEIPLLIVEKKEEAKAPVGFNWKDPSVLTAKIVFDKSDPKKVLANVETTPTIKDFVLTDSSETVNKFQDSVPVSLKFNVVAVSADGSEFKLSDIVIPNPVPNNPPGNTEFKKNSLALPFGGYVQNEVETLLRSVPQSKNVVLVRLVGFIKFANDAQPIASIGNPITIKVNTSEK